MSAALDQLLEELADRVAAKVLARLSTPSSHYTSRAGGPNPPGKSRAWALRNLKLVPGAKKVGRDWVVPAEAYDAWLSDQDTSRLVRASDPKPANDVEALAEEALVAAGYRRR